MNMSKTITLRIDDELLEKMNDYSKRNSKDGFPFNQTAFIKKALEEKLKEDKKK